MKQIGLLLVMAGSFWMGCQGMTLQQSIAILLTAAGAAIFFSNQAD